MEGQYLGLFLYQTSEKAGSVQIFPDYSVSFTVGVCKIAGYLLLFISSFSKEKAQFFHLPAVPPFWKIYASSVYSGGCAGLESHQLNAHFS